MFRNRAIHALNKYIDKLDAALAELNRVRRVAIDAKGALLRGAQIERVPIPSVETMLLTTVVVHSASVDTLIMLAAEAAEGKI